MKMPIMFAVFADCFAPMVSFSGEARTRCAESIDRREREHTLFTLALEAGRAAGRRMVAHRDRRDGGFVDAMRSVYVSDAIESFDVLAPEDGASMHHIVRAAVAVTVEMIDAHDGAADYTPPLEELRARVTESVLAELEAMTK
jgi:hypothetical protein